MKACPFCASDVPEGSSSCPTCGEKPGGEAETRRLRTVAGDVALAIIVVLAARLLAWPFARYADRLPFNPITALPFAGLAILFKLRYGKWAYLAAGLAAAVALAFLAPVLQRASLFWWVAPVPVAVAICVVTGRGGVLPGLFAGVATSLLVSAGDYLRVPLTPATQAVRDPRIALPAILLLVGLAAAGLAMGRGGRPRYVRMLAAWAAASAALWGATHLPSLDGMEFALYDLVVLPYAGILLWGLWPKSERPVWGFLWVIGVIDAAAWFSYPGDASVGVAPWTWFAALLAAAHHLSASPRSTAVSSER